MQNELAHIVAETHWGQRRVSNHGKLTWIDRQRALFQNANNAVTSARSHGGSLIASPASVIYVAPDAEERRLPRKVGGNVGGNVFGSQLVPTENWETGQSGKVLFFAGLGTTTSQARRESWLEEALEELATCPEDAIDDGFDEPSEIGLMRAKALIMDLAVHVESKPDIYPMDQGSIAIDVRHPSDMVGVLYLVEKDGSGALFFRSRKSKGRVRVEDAADLLKESGLSEMRRLGISL